MVRLAGLKESHKALQKKLYDNILMEKVPIQPNPMKRK